MNPVYEEYKQEHPEELEDINRLKNYSKAVELRLQKRRDLKLKRIDKCRRELYGDNNS